VSARKKYDVDTGDLKLEKMTRDTIKFKGYEPWYSVTYMNEDWQKTYCIKWVVGLIKEGILKDEETWKARKKEDEALEKRLLSEGYRLWAEW
jgi:hypothetical protein